MAHEMNARKPTHLPRASASSAGDRLELRALGLILAGVLLLLAALVLSAVGIT